MTIKNRTLFSETEYTEPTSSMMPTNTNNRINNTNSTNQNHNNTNSNNTNRSHKYTSIEMSKRIHPNNLKEGGNDSTQIQILHGNSTSKNRPLLKSSKSQHSSSHNSPLCSSNDNSQQITHVTHCLKSSSLKCTENHNVQKEKFSMRNAIEAHKYSIVRSNLQGNCYPDDPNEEIPFLEVYMTGLEYSVYSNDWKMGILFFLNGADPAYNCFDGTILESPNNRVASRRDRDTSSSRRRTKSSTHPAFLENKSSKSRSQKRRSKRSSNIPGFDGLYCLVDSNKEEKNTKIMSSLWLMRKCYDPDMFHPKSIMETIKLTRHHISTIDSKIIWNAYFDRTVITSLLCLHSCLNGSVSGAGFEKTYLRRNVKSPNALVPVPNDVAIYIMEYIMDDILINVIRESFRYISDFAATHSEHVGL